MIAHDIVQTIVYILIVLIDASLLIAAAISLPRLTETGKAMIFDVQTLYGGLRHPVSSINAGPASATSAGGAGVEPMMLAAVFGVGALAGSRSEEHTSELQSPCNIVCRLLLEKKKKLR